MAIRFVPRDGGALPPFKAGRYLSVAVDFGDGRRQLRQYSLPDAPGPGRLRISAEREDGKGAAARGGVSAWLRGKLSLGAC